MAKKRQPKKSKLEVFAEEFKKHIDKTPPLKAAAVISGMFLIHGAATAVEQTPLLKDYGPAGFLTIPMKPEDIPFSAFGVLGTIVKAAVTKKDDPAEMEPTVKAMTEVQKVVFSFFASYILVEHGVPFSKSLLGVGA